MNYTNIRYSVMLNDTQYEYLSDDHQGISRVKCFHTFLKMLLTYNLLVGYFTRGQ